MKTIKHIQTIMILINMEFFEKVYEIVKKIPAGYVVNYGDIAAMLRNKNYSRQVGKALHNNPKPSEIPCHRVVSQKGILAKNFAFGGETEQKKLLESENVGFDDKGRVKKEYFLLI